MQSTQSMEYCFTHSQPEPCQVCVEDRQRPPSNNDDRELALAVRAGLLGIVSALDQYGPAFGSKELTITVRFGLIAIVRALETRYKLKNRTAQKYI